MARDASGPLKPQLRQLQNMLTVMVLSPACNNPAGSRWRASGSCELPPTPCPLTQLFSSSLARPRSSTADLAAWSAVSITCVESHIWPTNPTPGSAVPSGNDRVGHSFQGPLAWGATSQDAVS